MMLPNHSSLSDSAGVCGCCFASVACAVCSLLRTEMDCAWLTTKELPHRECLTAEQFLLDCSQCHFRGPRSRHRQEQHHRQVDAPRTPGHTGKPTALASIFIISILVHCSFYTLPSLPNHHLRPTSHQLHARPPRTRITSSFVSLTVPRASLLSLSPYYNPVPFHSCAPQTIHTQDAIAPLPSIPALTRTCNPRPLPFPASPSLPCSPAVLHLSAE